MIVHYSQEIVCILFAFFGWTISDTVQQVANNNALHWLKKWFVWQGWGTVAHVILSFLAIEGLLPTVAIASGVVPITYLTVQTIDPIIATLVVYSPKNKRLGWFDTNTWINIGLFLFFVIMTVAAVFWDGGAYREGLVGRPQESNQIATAVVACVALFFATTFYGKIMFLGAFATLVGGCLMLFAQQDLHLGPLAFLDNEFFVGAHWAKLASNAIYAFVPVWLWWHIVHHKGLRSVRRV